MGDQVYSLRFFDPVSQRSQGEIERVIVTPAGVAADDGVTIIDYLTDDSVVVHRGIDELCQEDRRDGAGGRDEAKARLAP